MGYARLDDSFWISEKVDALSDKAFRLYVRSISFASAMNTDGIITRRSLRLLEGTPQVAQLLVDGGAWDAREDGWAIHNYTVHNSTAEERKKRATTAANSRWNNKGKNAPGMKPADASSNANSMQPASIEQCENDAYTTQLNSTHSKADAKPEAEGNTQSMPPQSASHRDLVQTLVSALPVTFRHDQGALDECAQFADDFPGMFAETAKALSRVRQKGEAPFPRNVRKYMPGWQEPGKTNGGPGESLEDRIDRYTGGALGHIVNTGGER